jgi:hypothetical protein
MQFNEEHKFFREINGKNQFGLEDLDGFGE